MATFISVTGSVPMTKPILLRRKVHAPTCVAGPCKGKSESINKKVIIENF